MHFFIITGGFILWYLAYEAKPNLNDEVTSSWEENNIIKRVRLLNILREG